MPTAVPVATPVLGAHQSSITPPSEVKHTVGIELAEVADANAHKKGDDANTGDRESVAAAHSMYPDPAFLPPLPKV